ncbi:MAG: phosphoglycerate dehydrogenase-like enzyme [Halioglobus sp.]
MKRRWINALNHLILYLFFNLTYCYNLLYLFEINLMKLLKAWTLSITACMLLIGNLHAADGTSPAAQVLIDQLGLRASSTPMADVPGWKPKKVLVQILPHMNMNPTEFKQQILAVAGDVELVFDESGGFIPHERLLADVDALIGVCTTPALKKAGMELRWVHNYFVGMDHCKEVGDIQRADIVFSNNKRLSGPAIAEHTIAMLMALTRNLPTYLKAQGEFKWSRAAESGVTFGELRGKTILIVGLGGIGSEIAWRAHGLGMRVIATRNSSRTGPDYVEYVGLSDELHALAAKADVVANALPLTESTTALFDKSFFDAVKPGAIFLSVGRGKSTVTDDLIEALQSGQLYGAGLDVTDPEPLAPSHALWDQKNIIITPHVSAAGADNIERTKIIAIENLRRYVAGEALLNVVDMGKGY